MHTVRLALPTATAVAALAGTALLVLALPVDAQEMAPAPAISPAIEEAFNAADLDVSGDLSFDETLGAYPEVTVDLFRTADADQSDALSIEEFQVLVASLDTMAG